MGAITEGNIGKKTDKVRTRNENRLDMQEHAKG